ncbi:MAG: tRNA (N6-isopentenyl adenosine(37)-C2)-methylthiotransferase MiaB [Oscillospiraceae bacterium]|nr:tRNA (N6-isopentenyl adenosine(37)-C2)-methylthiotransferase MiaB [Oscillospiraceae bacterium]
MNLEISKDDFKNQRKYIEFLSNLNNKKKIACVKTLGCQQNVADSEKIKGILDKLGYVLSQDPEQADLIIYNTCAVRENAEDRVFGNTGALKNLKKSKKDIIIGLCGCMTQQEHIVDKIKQSYPQVDLILGTHSLHLLPELLYRVIINQKRVIDINNRDGLFPEDIPVLRDSDKKAWVPIMSGCDNFCTYCIVPYVRGRERSRASRDIINEIKDLINLGYCEITLLGQNVNSYGKGLEEKINFSQLLKNINNLPGDFEISFMTSHPKDCSKELIDTIAESNKISKHLHLPVQSGSNKILKLMNRKYNIQEYKDLVDYAKSKIKNLILSSDIIVGFPGETYEDFLETKEIIKYIKYDFLYSFIYSKRNGTIAAKMTDIVSEKEKHQWLSELLKLQEEIKKNYK